MSFIGPTSRGAITARPSSTRMTDWCAARTTGEALEALDAAGLPAGPVLTPQQALDDPQVAAMEYLHAIADYPGLHRPVPVTGLPVTLSATPGMTPKRPPLLGEHTDAVLAELGYTPSEIIALRDARSRATAPVRIRRDAADAARLAFCPNLKPTSPPTSAARRRTPRPTAGRRSARTRCRSCW